MYKINALKDRDEMYFILIYSETSIIPAELFLSDRA